MERKKLNIPNTIVVEGKYDRQRLLEICSANILTTDGFGVFKKNEKLALFRELSKKAPIIVLTDSDGKISEEHRHRILEAFGFGGFENARDISALHIAKAGEENLELKTKEVAVDEYDEHDLHITEHTRFLLSAEFKRARGSDEMKVRFLKHMQEHEKLKK